MGDFAAVYEVERDGVRGALKQCLSDAEAPRQRFLIEVDALRLLSHEGIPRLIAQGDTVEPPFFVMELARGRPALSVIEEWQQERGRHFGDLETLRILASLFSALAHMHSKEYVHRDIKDANIILDVERQRGMLIDFGFCKRAGTSDTRTTDSFWRAGNARFAPPTKLNQPGTAVPSHDVFALGVLGYRLLTGKYPWSAGQRDDWSVLRDTMETTPLVPVYAVNSTVDDGVSRLIARLLNLDDASRPTAEDAEVECRLLLEKLTSRTPSYSPSRTSGIQFEHVVRDIIHGDIRLTDFEYKILNTPQLQRLREVKQLGLTNYVYIGADHSRLAHSLGTLDRVETLLRAIEDQSGDRIERDTREIARLYALTHDVSHIPMGHTIEDELGLLERHDKNYPRYERLVASAESELGQLLRSTDAGSAVLTILDPSTPPPTDDVVFQAVSGVVGADVLDYIDRDATHCGLDHRVDTAIFRQLRLHERPQLGDRRIVYRTSGKFGLRVDRQFAVESLLLERYALFLKVYTHSTKIAADALLGRALAEEGLGVKQRGNRIKDETFDWLSDSGLLSLLEGSRRDVVKELGRRLRRRQLPRAAYRGLVIESEDARQHRGFQDAQSLLEATGYATPQGRAEVEAKVARKSGIDRSRVFFYLPGTAPGYRRARHWYAESTTEAPLEREPSRSSDISSRHLGLWEAWLFVADADDREQQQAAQACQDVVGFANVIAKTRRPSLF